MNKPSITDGRPTPSCRPFPAKSSVTAHLAPSAIGDPLRREIDPAEIAWVRDLSDWLDQELLDLEDRFDEYVTRNSFRPTCR